MAVLALSVPNKNPSGKTMATRPFCFNLYIITDINKSAVSLLLSAVGKFCFTISFSLPPYGGFIKITLNLSSSV